MNKIHKIKRTFQLLVVCSCLWQTQQIQAMENLTPVTRGNEMNQAKQQDSSEKSVNTEVQQTTEEAINFETEEYVRITQPLELSNVELFDPEEDLETTFSQEINIMGETYKGMEIQIVTYTQDGETEREDITENPNYTEYKLKTVGATQIFSQLIKLHEGENHIMIYYTYEPYEIEGVIQFVITRGTDEIKEQIKNYIVTAPNAVLNQIPGN